MMRKFEHHSDTQLILSFQEGEISAPSGLVERYTDRIFTFVVFWAKDKGLAEDIYRGTFIRVIDMLREKRYINTSLERMWHPLLSHGRLIHENSLTL